VIAGRQTKPDKKPAYEAGFCFRTLY